ncbi:MAG: hypothetical protein H7338_03320 [Candidatus Sericytochromatia bacterium]|nr:hypothetical protein [Candidatus Sericytochromatia bacterium]
MSAIPATTNARTTFESSVRRMGPGYAATINGISNPIRIIASAARQGEQLEPAATQSHYGHVIDTRA